MMGKVKKGTKDKTSRKAKAAKKIKIMKAKAATEHVVKSREKRSDDTKKRAKKRGKREASA
jgi:hypothetical protein